MFSDSLTEWNLWIIRLRRDTTIMLITFSWLPSLPLITHGKRFLVWMDFSLRARVGWDGLGAWVVSYLLVVLLLPVRYSHSPPKKRVSLLKLTSPSPPLYTLGP